MSSSSRRVVSAVSDRRTLNDAIEFVAKGWMPISSQVVSLIRGKLGNGDYDLKRYELIADLRKDFSLFTWFLSQLSDLKPNPASFDIEEIVQAIEVQQLIELFSKADDANVHKREKAAKSQTLALKHGLTAVVSAEKLADKQQIDSNLAHICAGVRQLGINLVAWNYPRIFSRAMEHCQRTNTSLDKELYKILGYSPLQLGAEIALDWDKTGGLKAIVFQDNENPAELPAELMNQLGGKAAELIGCVELGESVAKLSTPEIYPDVAGLMPEIVSDVEGILGKGGFQELREQLRKTSLEYSTASAPFELDIEPELITQIAQNQLASQLIQANQWALKCPALMLEKFKNLYLKIDKHNISPTAINILVGDVIPNLGFTRGCVYIVEENKNKLNPILRIGDSPLSRYRQLDCSASDRAVHPVIAALDYSTPFIQENVPVNGDFVSHVTGIFGGTGKTGVLYLEMSESLASSADRTEPLLFFKAARQALADCLNIS